MILLLLLFVTEPVFASNNSGRSDHLEESVETIGNSLDAIETGLSNIESKANTCTENYDQGRTCPKAIPKGIRDSFVSPLRKHQSASKKLWLEKLKPLPALLKKPVELAELEKVDSCKGNEEVLVKDLGERLGHVKAGESAVDFISSGGSGRGTLEAYQQLHATTKKDRAEFEKMANACKQEVAGIFGGLVSIPDSPHQGFIKAFTPDKKFPNCASSVLQGYQSVANPKSGALAKINAAVAKLKSSFSTNRKNLEQAISQAKKRLENCKDAGAAKKPEGKTGEDDKAKKEVAADKGKLDQGEKKEEAPAEKPPVDASAKAGDCAETVTNPYGNTYTPNSCYKATGTAKERANNLAKIRKEDPAALEKALVDRSTPEAKAMSKKLLDEADAYAKSQKPPLPSPKVSSRDTVCGESCVAYLKAKSAETNGMDATTVKYLKTKAGQTQRRKLQDLSY